MPWQESCPVDERGLFVAEHLRGDLSLAALCRRYGVSRRTGYKWIERYEAEGVAGLTDRSRAPHHCPHRVTGAVAETVLAVRVAHPTWGPKKVRAWLDTRDPGRAWPAASTIGTLFDTAGLTVKRRRRSRVPRSAPLGTCGAPNEVWAMDFKGWFRTGDGRRCDPFTLSDAHSRYLLRCQGLEHPDGVSVWPILDAALREFGVPAAVRSDNGPPFASRGAGGLSWLAVQLIKAGTRPERITPGKPQENGRHERMHLTLKRETANPPAASLRAQQQRFDAFRRLYNEERPHEALGQTPPAKHYTASPRIYDGRLRTPEYPDTFQLRWVRSNGEIKWRGERIFIGEALIGEAVGLAEQDDGQWLVCFGPVELGWIGNDANLRRNNLARRPLRCATQGSAQRPTPTAA